MHAAATLRLRCQGCGSGTRVYRGTSLISPTVDPPNDHRRALGKVLLQGPEGAQFLMGEVPLYGLRFRRRVHNHVEALCRAKTRRAADVPTGFKPSKYEMATTPSQIGDVIYYRIGNVNYSRGTSLLRPPPPRRTLQ